MAGLFAGPARRRQLLLLVGDIAIVLLALSLSYTLRVSLGLSPPTSISTWLFRPWVLSVVLIHLVLFFVFNLYDLDPSHRRTQWLVWITFAVIAAVLASSLVLFLVAARPIVGRVVLFVSIPFSITGIFIWRLCFFRYLLQAEQRRRLVLVGFDDSFDKFVAGLSQFPVQEYEFVGVIAEGGSVPGGWPGPGSFLALNGRSLAEAVQELGADMVVCSIGGDLSEGLLRQVLALRLRGVEVYDLPAFYGQLLGRIPAFSVDASWVLQWIRDNRKSAVTANLERLIEAVIATFILLLMAPIMLIVAAAIKLDSKGAVFFLQERLGLHEVPFSVCKFRTMVENAEASTGPTWAEVNDPRVTRVGRFLRKTRLDEVPQLLNILRGEMGFVGCRPIRQHFADQLGAQIPFYSLRFSVRPGLTGWAQVQGDYGGSVEGHIEKFEYELYYLANSSLFMDAFILLKTLQVVLFGRGQ